MEEYYAKRHVALKFKKTKHYAHAENIYYKNLNLPGVSICVFALLSPTTVMFPMFHVYVTLLPLSIFGTRSKGRPVG